LPDVGADDKKNHLDHPFPPRVTILIAMRMASETSQITMSTVEDSLAFSVVSQVLGLIPLKKG
jgi:hypothetical protein